MVYCSSVLFFPFRPRFLLTNIAQIIYVFVIIHDFTAHLHGCNVIGLSLACLLCYHHPLSNYSVVLSSQITHIRTFLISVSSLCTKISVISDMNHDKNLQFIERRRMILRVKSWDC